MTTDQDAQAERLIEWLAKQVREICPPSLLADEHAWATRIVTAMREEHWRCVIPSRTVITARREGTPPDAHATELEAAREAFAAASDKHRNRETPAITRKEDHG
jgi:hypothetical protein